MVILLELDDSNQLPRDLFLHLNDIFRDADKGENLKKKTQLPYHPYLNGLMRRIIWMHEFYYYLQVLR